jgi:hypothetical protein
MQTNKATQGEINLYKKIKSFEVRANIGNSSAGYGWRPVCGGHYLGRECHPSEKTAITKGKIFVEDLKRRVDGSGCGACGDGCIDRKQCRVLEESPPIKAIPKKRARKVVTK